MKKIGLLLGILAIVIVGFLAWHSWYGTPDESFVKRTKVRFQLQWFDQAQFAGFYVAEARGFYKEENLDVEIIPGGFSTNPIQTVLTSNADIALVTGNKLLQAREQGYDLKAFGNVFNRSIACFMTRTAQKIRSPLDMVGKTVAVYRGYDTEHILLCLLTKSNIDKKDLNIVDAGIITPFIKGEVDAWPSYVINEPIRMQEEGIDVSILEPDNFGVQFYSDTYFCRTDYFNNNKETLQRFIRASAKGWEFASQYRDTAIAIMYETRNNLAQGSVREQQRKMLDKACEYLRGGDKHQMFYMSPDRWFNMEKSMKEAGILQSSGYVNVLCDFEFVNKALSHGN